MNSLLRNITSGTNSREWKVKDSLINELSSSVKEIQLSQSSRPDKSTPLETDDVTSSLCIAVEALFIHGLKDTLASRVTQAIRAGDVIERPQPNFWSPLLIISHREIIDQVNNLFLVTSDVGRCRAWLRLALNDGLLSSYLSAMLGSPHTLKPYYRNYALVRDPELLEVAQRLIQGIDAQPFALAVNSSLLNVWSDAPLALAGMWTSPVDCALHAAVDVVSTLRNDPVACPSPARIAAPGLDEDHALKIILGTPVRAAALPPDTMPSQLDAQPDSEPQSQPHSLTESGLGNSLTTRVGWSSAFQDLPVENAEPSELSESVEGHKPELVVSRQTSRSEMQSYHSLLESYNLVTGAMIGRAPDLGRFLQPHEPETTETTPNAAPNADAKVETVDAEDLADLGYEVVPNSLIDIYDIPEFATMVGLLSRLPTEQGLAKQNFACAACALPVGIGLERAAVCAFTAQYFCHQCYLGEEFALPARIVHNWDFRKYGISSKAAAFLTDIRYHPLIDIKLTNPRLYLVVDEMSVLLSLRIQLNLLRAYLFTCREPVIEELQKRVWPREYLYQHVHLYSVADLLEVPSGVLAAQLGQVVLFARTHVQTCWLCTQKGFVCEVCNNPKVIYPFDTTTTYRCSVCCAVFHTGCLDDSKPCPKCERRQRQAAQSAQAAQAAQVLPVAQLSSSKQANETVATAEEDTS